jgi:hypothetical protein
VEIPDPVTRLCIVVITLVYDSEMETEKVTQISAKEKPLQPPYTAGEGRESQGFHLDSCRARITETPHGFVESRTGGLE